MEQQSIYAKGYGTIAQTVTRDKRLTDAAKTIYSYLCSLAGKGNSAFPRRDTILEELGMGQDKFYVHLNKLKELGYIKVTQERDKSGRFRRNVFTIMQTVPSVNASPCREKSNTENPNTKNQGTYKYHLKDKNIKGCEKNHVKVKSCPPVDNPVDTPVDRRDVTAQKIAAYTEIIKDSISYADLSPLDKPLADDFISVIIDVLVTESEYIRICGENKPRNVVKHMLVRLDYLDITHCIAQFKAVTTPIKNKRQYMLTMMYNSRLEGNAHYTNLVKSEG